MISLITPAFNEGSNLPMLHERLTSVFRQLDWEWIIVDDHSRDNTFEVIERLVASDPRVRGIRLAHNSGSHLAFTCGLRHASGEVAALMVADLQDPPELLIQMLERWRSGVQVVWAVRRHQPGDGSGTQLYYWIMRNLVGMSDMPATGADFFLVDRVVIDAFLAAADRHVSIFALMMWLGFRREFIQYDKQPRTRGRSGWTLAKKLKLVVDSIVGFSDFPIWWLTYAGVAALVVALVPAVVAVVAYSGLNAALLLLAALVIGLFGCHLIALGILGHYVWRGLDAARKRPLYSIEAVAKAHDVPAAVAGDRRQ
ncbi:MAG TPA: glycosyltransferase family 2 protein [Vicinamibacterales bacterium]|nr:glycosyltransferase family 2 protein [Vicinamibacterales bacterium]